MSDRPGPYLIRQIDLARGLFAVLVVAAHACDLCWAIHPEAMHQLPESVRLILFSTVQAGFYWVMGFFVLSGYCIQLSAGRLLDAGRFPTGLYLKARLSRILPLYYLGLLFALLVETLVAPIRPPYYPDGVDALGFGAQLVGVQRLTRTFGSFAPSWSITNELFYYLLFGLLAASLPGGRGRPALLGLVGSTLIGGTLVVLHQVGYRHDLILGFGLLFSLGINWFLGALVAVHGPSLIRGPIVADLARLWPLGLLAAISLRAADQTPELAIDLLLGVTFSACLLRLIARDQADQADPRPVAPALTRLAATLGLASYPMYLFHGPILLALGGLIRQSGGITDWRLSWLTLFAAGVSAGLALGWTLERPIMRWRARRLAAWQQGQGSRPGQERAIAPRAGAETESRLRGPSATPMTQGA